MPVSDHTETVQVNSGMSAGSHLENVPFGLSYTLGEV